ncbi:squalene/phytoene synthase family protein [Candidatus Woesearchaeota archaeon]|jgi:phytoene synthase|nr:squalene/phytoene synthase family protein [Candidatus Woesearchaeota archaeon]
MSTKNNIFKKGSTTYYTSSIFFPRSIRKDVFTLYAFVRTADDLVDSVPQKKKEFLDFKNKTLLALRGKKSGYEVIDDFVDLYNNKKFRESWVVAFLSAMESDLKRTKCKSLVDTYAYIYGSAEVIGLFMAKIMNLKKSSYKHAMLLGKAMQYINFIRDINQDAKMNRSYLPLDEAKISGLKNLDFDTINDERNAEAFDSFLLAQLNRFFELDSGARKGFGYIRSDCLVPIMTAQDMFVWTAKKIKKNPRIVLRKQVKPGKHLIMFKLLVNYFRGE